MEFEILGIKFRFSPACTGNTLSPRMTIKPVQPRVYGEYIPPMVGFHTVFGSAPRVRGIQGLGHSDCLIKRFSPACTGNTTESIASGSAPRVRGILPWPFRARMARMAAAVQPRVCGEYPVCVINCLGYAGSAPRVRGIPIT